MKQAPAPILALAALIGAFTQLTIYAVRHPKRLGKGLALVSNRAVPYPGDPDYPWPTTEALALISQSDHEVCVCGAPIVLWDYPRQHRANGNTRWWVHVENARRTSHPVDGYRSHQGFAMPYYHAFRGLD